MEELTLDGNAAAGLLQEVFAVEVTTAVETCDGCGQVDELGALVLYRGGPGMVLRCRNCDSVLVKVATDGERIWIDLTGVRTLELRPG
jgi:hypothetical protein